jgi:glutaminyl-peptide cyclotransferase
MGRRAPLGGILVLFAVVGGWVLAARCTEAEPQALRRLRARVLTTYAHDPAAYTQGLLWHAGYLFESTGQYGESRLRRVDLGSGEVVQERDLPDSVFGEGLSRVGDRLVQLTWRAGRAWVYDLETFRLVDEMAYETEGWGLCYDGAWLWLSDGTHRLIKHDAQTFDRLGELEVTSGGRPQSRLNELECAEGWIYANIYGSDDIVQIDPLTGEVTAIIDASGLLTPAERLNTDVLNGIAYDPSKEVFYLTGKYWPRLFEVVFE